MRFAALVISCSVLAGCAAAPASRLADMLARHDEHPVEVCALAVDLDTGEVLLSRAARRLCRPASTMKLLTTSSICRRDLDRSFRTRAVSDGAPGGQVTFVGSGDPFLTAADVRRMAVALVGQGFGEVRGPIRVVDPLKDAPRWGEGWMWDDEPSTYQPMLSGAIVDRGCVTLALRGGADGLQAAILPVAGAMELDVQSGGGGVRATRGRYRGAERVVVTGELPVGATQEQRLSVPDPARFVGYVLADALRKQGAEVAQDVRVEVIGPRDVPAGVEAWCERQLAEVVVETNKVSDNLGAELLLRDLARVSELHPVELGVESETIGRMTVQADLEALGVGDAAVRVADGSGVSHYNLVSADLLVRLLVDMHERGGRGYELFRRSLPVAGVDGTLANRMKGTAAERRVFAKTGTISAVSNLAGYVDTRSGRRLAFAILCQNFVGSAKPWRALQDRVCAALAEL